ncbi:MAG: DEAD/DEAH box helicase [Promethearchaeati archaeon SRVP18_Atabeyarchaeia-1]
MKISELAVPESVKAILEKEGYVDLYPPQEDAIRKGVLEGKNLVLAVPTASGKTLVAELCMVKSILESGGKAIYLVPLKALADEKNREFKKYEKIGVRVVQSTGDLDSSDQWLRNFDLVVSTTEKVDSLIRHHADWMGSLTTIVADEVHLINENERGPTLEVVLARLMQLNPSAQVLALSATISNSDEIAKWLKADLVTSGWRPVKLREGVYDSGAIYFGDGEKRQIRNTIGVAAIDLALKAVRDGGQVLIFTDTRKKSVNLASRIAKHTAPIISLPEKRALKQVSNSILRTGEVTKVTEMLSELTSRNVAFHHAGLRYQERRIIEAAFRENKVKIICATPTLCLSPDTKIWHGMAETEVSELRASDPLYALNGTKLVEVRASQISRLPSASPLVEISSVSGRSIKVTPNHRILIKRGTRPLVIPANEVRETDKIATVRNLETERVSQPSISDFVIDNRSESPDLAFSSELSYFLGVMLGDGYSGAETWRGVVHYKGTPSIVGTKTEIFPYVEETCSRLGISCRRTVNFYGTPQLILGKNKWFREFLVRCGVEVGSHKYINNELMSMSKRNIGSLLQGLFDSDGYVNKGRNVGFANTSRKLIDQVQKLLLRFGIVTWIRKRRGRVIKTAGKEYSTKPSYELIIADGRCIVDFGRNVGFHVAAKQREIDSLVSRIEANLLYVSCRECGYKIHRSLFTGRTKVQKQWGKTKLLVIKLLGERGELGSREIRNILGREPRKNETRLNQHYHLISKRRIGTIDKNEWFWSLNPIGKWIFSNYIAQNRDIDEFFKPETCPQCGTRLEQRIRGTWRANDFQGDIYWDFIKRIGNSKQDSYVYDVALPDTPENDHMFVANGFIVHNSAGVNLPARMVIIDNYRRYETGLGYYPIPVLEYKQMAGRAGRPKYDRIGEAVLVARGHEERATLLETYVYGEPEKIWSKLGKESVLRSHILSSVAMGLANSQEEILSFIGRTFYGHQYDPKDIEGVIETVLEFLVSENMLKESRGRRLAATPFGSRVSELYIDPKSAVIIRDSIQSSRIKTAIGVIHMMCHTPDMEPIFLRRKDYKEMESFVDESVSEFLVDVPDPWSNPVEYEQFLSEVKTTRLLLSWMEESPEEGIIENFDVGSGDIFRYVESADWLLYSTYEIAKLLGRKDVLPLAMNLRRRIVEGVKEELLELVNLKGIGRVRARMLFNAGFKTVGDLRNSKPSQLLSIPTIGREIAKSIYEQVGVTLEESEWSNLKSGRPKESQQQLLTLEEDRDKE